MKDSNELVSEHEQEREVFQAFASAKTVKEKAARLHSKAVKAQRDAEWLLDHAIGLGEALKRRRGYYPYGDSGRQRVIYSDRLDRARRLLIKALGMLGSDRAGERASAALKVEKFRIKIGKTWDELILQEEDLADEEIDCEDLEDDDDDEDDEDTSS